MKPIASKIGRLIKDASTAIHSKPRARASSKRTSNKAE